VWESSGQHKKFVADIEARNRRVHLIDINDTNQDTIPPHVKRHIFSGVPSACMITKKFWLDPTIPKPGEHVYNSVVDSTDVRDPKFSDWIDDVLYGFEYFLLMIPEVIKGSQKTYTHSLYEKLFAERHKLDVRILYDIQIHPQLKKHVFTQGQTQGQGQAQEHTQVHGHTQAQTQEHAGIALIPRKSWNLHNIPKTDIVFYTDQLTKDITKDLPLVRQWITKIASGVKWTNAVTFTPREFTNGVAVYKRRIIR
jgi:hypothetical protein